MAERLSKIERIVERLWRRTNQPVPTSEDSNEHQQQQQQEQQEQQQQQQQDIKCCFLPAFLYC